MLSEMSKQLKCSFKYPRVYKDNSSVLELNLSKLLEYRKKRLERLYQESKLSEFVFKACV